MTRDPRLHSLYGLKFNPFLPDVPLDALYIPGIVGSFIERCESHLTEGGFALLTGLPGLGKSVALRLLCSHLSRRRDVMVRSITYPQCRISDFYRELGDAFGLPLNSNNRWGSFKMVREKWQTHLESTSLRPILVIDEAQETLPVVLRELRLLTSKEFDSQTLLFVILVGDLRLLDTLHAPDLLPIESRLRTRVRLEPVSVTELTHCLNHVLEQAGNTQLFTPEALTALVEHSAGNHRTMMLRGNELLMAAVQRDARQIDEKLFFEIVANPTRQSRTARKRR